MLEQLTDTMGTNESTSAGDQNPKRRIGHFSHSSFSRMSEKKKKVQKTRKKMQRKKSQKKERERDSP